MKKNSLQQKIKEWLFFANEDLKMAKLLLREDIYNGVCFHAQQAVEKATKAYILKKYGKTPKIHSLSGLLDRYPPIKKEFVNLMDEVEFLDQFYVPTRYPDAFPGSLPEGLPDQKDAEKAVEYAEEIVGYVSKKIVL